MSNRLKSHGLELFILILDRKCMIFLQFSYKLRYIIHCIIVKNTDIFKIQTVLYCPNTAQARKNILKNIDSI